MLAILTTHPIQYQVPLWQILAREGRVPFEVWYLSEHATKLSRDIEFGREFAWDIDMLKGYPYRILKTAAGATPNTFWRTRITESLPKLFAETKTKVLWVNGWQVAAYWQAVWAAHRAGVQVWMRGESNALLAQGGQRLEDRGQRTGGALKRTAKRLLLGQLFRRVDHFLCIGTVNRELYRSYSVPESKLHMAMYAVDNDRFRRQAEAIRGQRSEIRSQWRIPNNAFCVLFCGKFIPKKHPMDLIKAAQLLLSQRAKSQEQREELPMVHLLFAGSGQLGAELRANSHVVYDAEKQPSTINNQLSTKPAASFAGFLNQTEISRTYVAADCLVLPSDYDETWGLVVNEAMASGLPCIISDRCGCALDMSNYEGNSIFHFGDAGHLAQRLAQICAEKRPVSEPPSLTQAAEVVARLCGEALNQRLNECP